MIMEETVSIFGTYISPLTKKTVNLPLAYFFWQTITFIQVTKPVLWPNIYVLYMHVFVLLSYLCITLILSLFHYECILWVLRNLYFAFVLYPSKRVVLKNKRHFLCRKLQATIEAAVSNIGKSEASQQDMEKPKAYMTSSKRIKMMTW
jgi:hypothetical protein